VYQKKLLLRTIGSIVRKLALSAAFNRSLALGFVPGAGGGGQGLLQNRKSAK
jgi:hypothetical protein